MVAEDDKSLTLLNSLPESYENFIDAIEINKTGDLKSCDVETTSRNEELQKNIGHQQNTTSESLSIKLALNKNLAQRNKIYSKHKQHKDNGYGENDNTKKISVFTTKGQDI